MLAQELSACCSICEYPFAKYTLVQGIWHAAAMLHSRCQFYVTRKLANGKQAASQIAQQVGVTLRPDHISEGKRGGKGNHKKLTLTTYQISR